MDTDRVLQSRLDIQTCLRCSLGTRREALVAAGDAALAVPAELGPNATPPLIAFMCEAPGAHEEATGHPLVGRAGQMFNRILELSGTSRDQVLMLNRVRCRPPNNDLASYPDATTQCDYWVKEELAAYDPKVVVLMGNTATRAIFGADVKISKVRGTMRSTGEDFDYGARLWVPTYHPSAVMRTRRLLDEVVADVTEAVKEIDKFKEEC